MHESKLITRDANKSKGLGQTHITARSCRSYLAIGYSHDEPPGGNPKLRYRIQKHIVSARADTDAYKYACILMSAHICPREKMEYVSERSNLSQTESSLVCPYRMTVHLVRFAPMQLSKKPRKCQGTPAPRFDTSKL